MDASEFAALYARSCSYENVPVPRGELTPRERFSAIMEFQKPDRIIDTEFGYWNNTLKHREGLPSYVDCNEKADLYFGFDVWRQYIPANLFLEPPFERELVEQDGRRQILYDEDRVKCEVFLDGTDTIPHYLEFPIRDRASYLPFKQRLQPLPERRIGVDLERTAEQVRGRNYLLQANGGSTAGMVRNWMGFEGIALGIYDQPELLEEILSDLGAVSEAVARRITAFLEVDLVSWWEDIAFKTGPIVSPEFFRTRCGPVMRRVMDVYRARGTRYGFVDCDGNFASLVPTWLQSGVNILFPLEVASGIHPEALRRAYPGVRMMGGVDKVILTRGREAIRRELRRLRPLVEEGGFIPHVDHRVQADVAYADYLYYLEAKRELFGIPNRVQG
jgi:hypothetical protein